MDLKNIKSLTASRLQILQDVEAKILEGEESLKATMEYLFAVSATIPELIKASTSKTSWNLAVMTFGDDIDLESFKEYEAHIEADFLRIESANVEPTEKDGGGKD